VFLALRDLRFARGRFALMGIVVGLIAVLAVLLTGLANGLVNDGVSALRSMPATHLAFEPGVEGNLFSRSSVDPAQARRWSQVPGVREATPYGNALAHAKEARTGKDVDIAVFGVEPGSFLAPEPDTGRPLEAGADGVLVSRKLTDEGIKVGDTLVVERSEVRLPVVGTVGDASYGHVAVVYAPLKTWQRVQYGLPGDPPAAAFEVATAIALDGEPGSGAPDARVLSLEESYGHSPGYTAEQSTMKMIQFFLYVISMFVVGAFFVVWTVQRKDEIALVRALGGSVGYLVRDAVAQVLVVLVSATVVGAALGAGLIALIMSAAPAMPIALVPGPIMTAMALLVALGVLGTVAALRRITSTDPLLALGGNR
jgi:putative ABC transport system permease protein